MLDKKIIYRDPKEQEIGAIIDLTDRSMTHSTPRIGSFKGRHVQQIDGDDPHQTIKKLERLQKNLTSIKVI